MARVGRRVGVNHRRLIAYGPTVVVVKVDSSNLSAYRGPAGGGARTAPGPPTHRQGHQGRKPAGRQSTPGHPGRTPGSQTGEGATRTDLSAGRTSERPTRPYREGGTKGENRRNEGEGEGEDKATKDNYQK
jgi:hypothetical protein